MQHDAENHLTGYNNGAVTFGYDGDGLRAWKQNGSVRTYYLYDGTEPVCEVNATGTVTARNFFGANGLFARQIGVNHLYYTFDPAGNVANYVTSPAGASNVGFDAYGKRYGDPYTNPFGYGGQWGYTTDTETGMILCTHRYYDPVNGRWLTRDPIGYEGGVNLYGYVGGDPVNNVDPEGLAPGETTVSLCIDLCKAISPKRLKNIADIACASMCAAYSNKGCESLAEKCEIYTMGGSYPNRRRAELCWLLHGVICNGNCAPKGYRGSHFWEVH